MFRLLVNLFFNLEWATQKSAALLPCSKCEQRDALSAQRMLSDERINGFVAGQR